MMSQRLLVPESRLGFHRANPASRTMWCALRQGFASKRRVFLQDLGNPGPGARPYASGANRSVSRATCCRFPSRLKRWTCLDCHFCSACAEGNQARVLGRSKCGRRRCGSESAMAGRQGMAAAGPRVDQRKEVSGEDPTSSKIRAWGCVGTSAG